MLKSIITILMTSVFYLSLFSQQTEGKTDNEKNTLLYRVDKDKYFSFMEYTKLPLLMIELNNSKVSFEKNISYSSDLKYFLDKNMELIQNRPKTLLEKGILRDQLLKIDYDKLQTNKLSANFYLVHNSKKETYISLGSNIQFNKAIRFQPNNRFSFDLGGYFSRQFDYLYGDYSDTWGTITQIRYSLTNKIQFKLWGEYAKPSGENNLRIGYPFYPASNIGSSVLLKIKDQAGAEFGVKYQYYEFKKSWDTEVFGKLSYDF